MSFPSLIHILNLSHSIQFVKKIKTAYLLTHTQNFESGDSKQIIFKDSLTRCLIW